MAFSVHCKMQIHEGASACYSTEDVWVYYDLELPFVPFNGLVVVERDDLWITLKNLHWRDGRFVSYNDDKRFYSIRDGMFKQAMWNFVKENYLDLGWLIEKGGLLWPRCPAHGLGMQPEPATGAMWKCSFGEGHTVPHYQIDFGYDTDAPPGNA